ncbi:MAG TPA: OsmC family protein [Longimicrobiales bacterium]|nr:OsmC family protein [Longimicrobiales bacterium]
MERTARLYWNRAKQFVSVTGSGHGVVVDASPELGGLGAGPSNTELLLTALGGCSGMDVVSILTKMRVAFDDLEIEVRGTVTEEHPRYLSHAHIIYTVRGADVPEESVRRAVELSQERYCLVANTLRGRTQITYEYRIEPPNG